MDIIKYSINKPVTVAVAVIIVVMFGIIGLTSLPVQLTPDVETPKITVTTIWPGATPADVEKDVIEKQEEALKGLKGLVKMESQSYNNMSEITLEFTLETDTDNALLRVSNKLNEVSSYPDNVEKPVIDASGAQSSPVVWMMLKTKPENKEPIQHYKSFFENEVRQYLERVVGVGSLFVFGGTEDEFHVVVDTEKMARYKVSINQVIAAVRSANTDTAAGTLGINKKNYRIRTVSAFQNKEDALNIVVFDDGVRRVYLRDVATVENGFEKRDVTVTLNDGEMIVVGVRKEKGANVLEMTDTLEARVKELNEGILAKKGLYFEWAYDQRPYITNAIDLVKKNVMIGAILAVIVLFTYLRSVTSTITTALAIPISAIGTFIFMWIMGRNLNIVSLAGISFAVGMLVDNAIVVLENIDRHRSMGKKALDAAYEGTKEVWGAVLASTATTVAVFLPVIFMSNEAGQLFQDIAIAITFSILLSLMVSISVIPTVINLFYKRSKLRTEDDQKKSAVGSFFVNSIMSVSDVFLKNAVTRIATILVFTVFSVVVAMMIMPPAEYLPQGNRNLILNIMIPPPGYSVEKFDEMGHYINKELKPHFSDKVIDNMPPIERLFYVAADRIVLFGAISKFETQARGMMPKLMQVMNSIPGVFGVSIQTGIFQDGLGGGRTVDINVSGNQISDIITASRTLFGVVGQQIKGARIRPIPSIEDSYPEVRIVPDKKKLVANGLTEADLGVYVDVLMDGRKIDEYGPDGVKNVDLIIKGDDKLFETPEQIMNSTLVNGFGDMIQFKDVARLEYSQGMPQINHLERRRNITLQVTPPEDVPLQQAMGIIKQGIIPELTKKGMLNNVDITIGGNADKLSLTMDSLFWNLILAVVITYLLMTALFENFLYPFIILFSVPLAAAGGFIGLKLVNIFVAPQGFDVLAMLGFIILVGTVVNNAILIVHQSLNNVRYEGYVGVDAIKESVRTRIRPIFMSASTSLLGMLPLAVSTGAGSELYRGLGSIILGGLALSTVFTLFVIPALLAFFIGFERSRTNENA